MNQLLFGVFLFELVDTSGRIYQHIFAGKERVRHIGDLEFDKWILVAVFPFNRLFRGGGRATQK
jgi:hypothetical protein